MQYTVYNKLKILDDEDSRAYSANAVLTPTTSIKVRCPRVTIPLKLAISIEKQIHWSIMKQITIFNFKNAKNSSKGLGELRAWRRGRRKVKFSKQCCQVLRFFLKIVRFFTLLKILRKTTKNLRFFILRKV